MLKTVLVNLIKNSPLAIMIIGLLLFVFGAAGGWPSPKFDVHEPGWRLALAVMGTLVASLGGVLFWKQHESQGSIRNMASDISEEGRRFEGRYYAEDDRNYVNTVTHVAGKFFAIENPDWDGVGIFEGLTYWGVFKYKTTARPSDRGRHGVHKLEMKHENQRWFLRVYGSEIGKRQDDEDDWSHWQGTWFKAEMQSSALRSNRGRNVPAES